LAQQNPPTTVKYVDLKKYVGLWYEFAKIPNSFQDQCVKNTTAKYTLTDDGEIKVTNSCIDEDGKKMLQMELLELLIKNPMQN
jgi:apolipoprotein D and lipocalin family protein